MQRHPLGLLLIVAVIGTGCASQTAPTPVAVPELRPGVLVGYLQSAELPNSLTLLPPPPAADSAQLQVDEAYSERGLTLRNTPAWALAISDADLSFPHAAETFSCALSETISETDTPRLYMLLRRTMADAAASTSAAKDHYARTRPFVTNGAPMCTPADREALEKNGSYPSGHSAIGMTWALVLTEISPDQTDAILARGRAFALSRVVCNVHWMSDTLQGRYMAAYTVARLHADPTFQADLRAARTELDAARAQAPGAPHDCGAEAAGIGAQQALEH